MDEMKKRDKIVTTHEADIEFDKSANEFTQAIVESLEKEYQSDLEPFEHYSRKVRGRILNDVGGFRERLIKGYYALMHELREEVQHVEEEPKMPPRNEGHIRP
jgi:hypothetical protein